MRREERKKRRAEREKLVDQLMGGTPSANVSAPAAAPEPSAPASP